MRMEARILQKIVVIGQAMTGKTCLMRRYTLGGYVLENYKATVGADFSTKDITFGDYRVTLQVWCDMLHDPLICFHFYTPAQVWDTAGSERFASLGREYYRGADMCVLVYAVDDMSSFDKLTFWYDSFIEATGAVPTDFPFVVLGNKCDLDEASHIVTQVDVANWCKARGNMPHFLVRGIQRCAFLFSHPKFFSALFRAQVSALNGDNVDEAFGAVLKAAIMRRVKDLEDEDRMVKTTLNLRLDSKVASGTLRPGCEC